MAWFIVRRDLDTRAVQYFSERPPEKRGVWLDGTAGALATNEAHARCLATVFNEVMRKVGKPVICLALEVEHAGDL